VVPSASIAFSRISPAPSSAARAAHATASCPADLRPPGVHRQHQHLAAEPVGDLGHQRGPVDRGGVDRDLVGTGAQQPVDVRDAADTTADGQRDEHLLGGRGDDLHRRRPALVRGGDVEEGELVGPLLVVEPGQLDRVTGVAQLAEVDPLHHPTAVDVEARDHPDRERHADRSGQVSASASSSVNRPS
jgi:hypothetical protein